MKITIEKRLYYLDIATIAVLQAKTTEETEKLIVFHERESFCFPNNDFHYFIKTLFKFWAEKR